MSVPDSRITHTVSMVTVSLQLHQDGALQQNPEAVRTACQRSRVPHGGLSSISVGGRLIFALFPFLVPVCSRSVETPSTLPTGINLAGAGTDHLDYLSP